MEDRTYPTPEKDYKNTTEEDFVRLCGDLNAEFPYGLTNDYMFHAVFQRSPVALKSLAASALGVRAEEITSCELLNPIIIGEVIDSKTCVLDLHVCVNHEKNLDMEMELWGIVDWPKRSVFYLCKMYTNLRAGEDYNDAKPCVHISFIKRSPFVVKKQAKEKTDKAESKQKEIVEGQSEVAAAREADGKKDSDLEREKKRKFVSRYLFMNPEDGQVYTDDVSLTVVDMSMLEQEVEKAEKPEKLTEEEARKLDETKELRNWIRLIRAESWEEAVKVAKESEAMRNAVVTMHKLSKDEKVRLQCEAREKYEGDMRGATLIGEKRGEERGEKRGVKMGVDIGMDVLNSLNQKLLNAGRFDDLRRACTDKAFQQGLLKEYRL